MTRRHPLVAMHRQRGAALLAIILLAVLGLLTFIVAQLASEHRPQKRQQESQQRLALARDALVGYATRQWCAAPQAGQTPQWRLPCPAGPTTDGVAVTGCSVSTPQTGRLPWRTLLTGPLRDDAAECFWYQREPSNVNPSPPADTVIGRIIAPGEILPGQARPGAQNGACGDHATSADYLEAVGNPARNDVMIEVRYADLQLAETRCPAPSACTSNALSLLSNISGTSNNCRVPPGNSVSASCQTAANALAASGCSCAGDATAFITPPCINNLNPPQCQAAVAALQSCS